MSPSEDLAKSGLVAKDMRARELGAAEKAACGVGEAVEGYVIPYFNIEGKALPFYRLKLIDHDPKYKQPRKTANHVYFPPDLPALLNDPSKDYVIVVEGEKKAALLVKLGYPAIAFGGVDNWRTKQLILPKDTEFQNAKLGSTEVITAKLPDGYTLNESGLAEGMEQFIQHVHAKQKKVVIIYDTDTESGPKFEVQRAASTLGFELRFYGIPFAKIRQAVLPQLDPSPIKPKTAVDDLIVQHGVARFDAILQKALVRRSAFPRHPNVRDWISKRLQARGMARKGLMQVAIAILADLDANGQRLRSTVSGKSFYFSHETMTLLPVMFGGTNNSWLQETPFGRLLYSRYGISPSADSSLANWLATLYSGEDPVEEVTPHRIIARRDHGLDEVNYQINDGQFVRITAASERLEVYDNGTDGILFESGHVKPLDAADIIAAYDELARRPAENWWADVLSDCRLEDQDKARQLYSLLYYVSPWLYKWRGIQLPVELVIGESGSGKSTLYELRLRVLTGDALLRNAPTDLKDWHASIASSGGLHVTDNVQLTERGLRQRLSDELCRLVTEPDPHIEMRRYYTNAELMRIPISCVYAITAIQMPFTQVDILQRSIMVKLDKGAAGNVVFDSYWKDRQMERYGGRAYWIAHHMLMLHRFFKAVKTDWDPNYRAKHRLVNLEQSLVLMAKVVGIDPSWIPQYLAVTCDTAMSEADWALEGLAAFAEDFHKYNADKSFTVNDVADWCSMNPDYQQNHILCSSRSLGKYFESHKDAIARTAHIQLLGKKAGKTYYCVRPKET
jgi:hypothetical protein